MTTHRDVAASSIINGKCTTLSEAAGRIGDLGDEYWYAFKAKEATTIVNRAAAAARHLIGKTSFSQ
jgi:CO/xanthine dehydrogenase FAD-binding subunit